MKIERPRCVVWVPDLGTLQNIARYMSSLGIERCPLDILHMTIIYSKNEKPVINDPKVGPPPKFPITVEPPYEMELFGPPGHKETLVIHIPSFPAAATRNAEYTAAGAISDFSTYKSHITVAKAFKGAIPPPPKFPLTFTRECDWEHIQVDLGLREAAHVAGKPVINPRLLGE